MINFFCFLFPLVFAQSPRPQLQAPLIVNEEKVANVWVYPAHQQEPTLVESQKLIQILEKIIVKEKISLLIRRIRSDQTLTVDDINSLGIKSTFDEKTLELNIEVPLSMLLSSDVSLSGENPLRPHLHANDPWSGYFNYSLSQNWDQTGQTSQQAQVNLVQGLSWAVFETQANTPHWYRGDTRLVKDQPEQFLRWTLGDLNYRTSGFQNYLPAAGFSVARVFSLHESGFARTLNATQVELARPATVDVYVNGSLISRKNFNKGIFDLKDLPLLSGKNQVRLVLTDDLGQVQTMDVNLLFDSQLLALGTHEFTYNAGRWRDSSFDNYEYPENSHIISLFHRYGVNSHLTIGIDAQYLSKENQSPHSLWGSEFLFLTRIGFFQLNGGQSKQTQQGNAFRVGYRSLDVAESILPIKWILNSQRNESHFVAPNSFANGYLGYDEINLIAGVNEHLSMGLGGSYWYGESSPNKTIYQMNAFYFFNPEWRLTLDLRRQIENTPQDQVVVTLNWMEKNGKYSSYVRNDSLDSSTQLSLQRLPRGLNKDWSSSLFSQTTPQNTTLNAQAEVYTSKGSLGINQYVSSQQTQNTSLRWRSAVAWSEGELSLARSINDSFVILSNQEAPSNSVISVGSGYDENRIQIPAGKKYALSDLTSYQYRTLQFIPKNISHTYSLNKDFATFYPSYRSGRTYRFYYTKQVMLKGQLLNYKNKPMALISAEIYNQGKKLISSDFFTDEQGHFILTGLEPGSYFLRLSDLNWNEISIVIPPTEQESLDIGVQIVYPVMGESP